VADEPIQYGFLDEPTQHGPAPYWPDQYGPAQYGPAQYGPAQYEPAQYGFPDEPAQPRPVQYRLLEEPTGEPRLDAAKRHHWLDMMTRHPWYTALSAGTAFMMLASGVMFIMPKQPPSAMMTDCRPVTCHAPSARPAAGPMARSGAAHDLRRSAKPRVNPSSTRPAAGLSVPASVAPQPAISVTYALVARWPGGMMGEFTIANNSSTSLTGWELSAAFPGDQIQVTWGPTESNPGSDTLSMSARPGWPAIAPGGSQSGYFLASGDTFSPSECTFNGAAC